jgi:hypothetical protein
MATTSQLDLPRVRLFKSGVYGEGTDSVETWTVKDLDAIVRNYWQFRHLYQPPVVIGHIEESRDGSHTAVPAVGVTTGLWREGRHLYGSFSEINPKVRQSMDSGALRSLSVELYRDPSEADLEPEVRQGASGPMLRRVSLLGGHPPRVKGLGNPPWAAGEPVRYGCRPGWIAGEHAMSKTADDTTDEAPAGSDVDRDHLSSVLLKSGFSRTFLDSLPDGVLAGLVAEVHDRTLGGPPAADAAAEEPPADTVAGPDDQLGDDTMPPREQMIQDLAGAGQDQATLEAMDDASLFELWKQAKGGGTPPAPTAMAEKKRTKKGPQQPVVYLTMETLSKFGEATAKAAIARSGRKTRQQEDEEFMAAMVEAGRLTPAQVDKAGGSMRQALTAASPICFGEGKSARELLMDAIRGGPAVRSYGERLAVGSGGVAGGTEEDVDAEVKGYMARKHGKRGA